MPHDAGRGKDLLALSPQLAREAIDTIFTRTEDLIDRGRRVEILTVDNHADGPYLSFACSASNIRGRRRCSMITWNGVGRYSSGVGIANIDFSGNVHADQFSMFRSFGNVKERKFSHIWQDTGDRIMAGLKDRLELLEGRCAGCRFKHVCGGALRARAEITTGNPWASDPGCYLTEEEITADPVASRVRHHSGEPAPAGA